MKQFLITVAGVFLGLILFFVAIPVMLIGAAAGSSNQEPTVASETVLSIDLRQPIIDQTPVSAFGSFGASSLSVVDLVRKLEAAETDTKIKGLLVRASEGGMAPAHAEEINTALASFKASGKFVVVHAQGFEYPTISNYSAISSASEIWMQEASDFAATGMVSETTFLGGLFEKFGITPEFEQFYEYKNAANVYTQKDYTAAHREATESLLGSVFESFVVMSARDRKITPDALKGVLDRAPISGKEAVTAKLVDKLGRPEDAMDAVLERAGENSEILDFSDYQPTFSTSGPVIALVGGEGAIVTGADEESLFGGDATMVGDTQARAIRDAADDSDVKAIVYRVSSGGGSAIASDQIWAAVEYAKAQGKPVVISMGAYAASGGYFVSAPANTIVALPTSITGSIGVLGGKFAINDALKRYTGANSATIAVGGPYTTTWVSLDRMTNSQKEAFRAAMERIYLDFTGKVATGRKMPVERVREIAKGRVWTGVQGKALGLVDQLGGLRVAIAKAKELAKIDAKTDIHIKTWPEAENPIEALSSLFGTSATAIRGLGTLGALVGDERLARVLRTAIQPDRGVRTEEPILVR